MPNGIIYTRVSDPSQVENTSLAQQKKICEYYAIQQGITVVKTFKEEGVSAKTVKKRPELRNAIEYATDPKNRISHIVVYKIDRYSRDLLSGLDLMSQLAKSGVDVVSATEHFEKNSSGNMVKNMLMVIAQYDNEQKSERVTHAMKAKFESGFWVWKPPLGYKRKYDSKEKNKNEPTIIDEPYRTIIVKLFEEAAKGLKSKKQLAKLMNQMGYEHVHGEKADPKTIDTIIQNSYYYGQMHAKNWKLTAKGNHEPMIDEETWLKANHFLYNTGRKHDKNQGDQYPLKQLMRCVHCNEEVTAYSTKGKSIHYYECGNRKCLARPKVRRMVPKAHEEFIDFLNQFRPSKAVWKLFKHMVFGDWDRINQEIVAQQEAIQTTIDSYLEKKEEYIRDYKKGFRTEEEAKALIEKDKTEITILEIEKSDLKIKEYDHTKVQNFAEYFFSHLGEVWDRLDYQGKLSFQKILFPRGVPYSRDGFRTELITQISPSISLLTALADENSKNVTPQGIEPWLPG